MATSLTESDVIKMISSLSNWGRWGADDQLGTMNLITPAKRKRAAASSASTSNSAIAARASFENRARKPSSDLSAKRHRLSR